MPQAKILVNGVIGSNDDLPINSLVQLNNQNIGGESTYTWAILDQPPGTADTLSSASIQNPSFTPKKEGSYLIKLTINLGLPDEQSDTVITGIRQLKSLQRIPAAGETTQADTVDGWATAMNALLRSMDSFLSDPAIIVGAAGATGLSKGTVVRAAGGTTIKVGLPGQETVPNFTKALATTLGQIDELLFVIEGAVIGGGTPALNALCRARYVGRLSNMPVTGAAGIAGDVLYVSDTGTVSTAPGTLRRQIGSIMAVIGGGYYDVMVDGVGGADITPINSPYVIFGPGGTLTNAFRIDAASPTPFTSNVIFLSGGATVTPLIVKANAAQTADVFEVQNSAGGALLKVTAAGKFDGAGHLTTDLEFAAGIKAKWANWCLVETSGEFVFSYTGRTGYAKFSTDVGPSGITQLTFNAPLGEVANVGADDIYPGAFLNGVHSQLRATSKKVVEAFRTTIESDADIWSPDESRNCRIAVNQTTGVIDIMAQGTGGSDLGILTLNSSWKIDTSDGSMWGIYANNSLWGISDPVTTGGATIENTSALSYGYFKRLCKLPKRERFPTFPTSSVWASPSEDFIDDLAWEAQTNNVYISYPAHTTIGRPAFHPPGSFSSLGLKVFLNTTSRLVFSYQVKADPAVDFFYLYIDNVAVLALPCASQDTGGGLYVSDPLPPGFHNFTWRFLKASLPYAGEVCAITDVSVLPEADMRDLSDGFLWQDEDWTQGIVFDDLGPPPSPPAKAPQRFVFAITGSGGAVGVNDNLELSITSGLTVGDNVDVYWGIAGSILPLCSPTVGGFFIEFALHLNLTSIARYFAFRISVGGGSKIDVEADRTDGWVNWKLTVGGTTVLTPFLMDDNWHVYRLCCSPAGVTLLRDTVNTSGLFYINAGLSSPNFTGPSMHFYSKYTSGTPPVIALLRYVKWRGSKLHPSM